MTFIFDIPGLAEPQPISLEAGSSLIFVGANGSGKTRLAVHIEKSLGLKGHRISAHRALTLNPAVAKIPERDAIAGLRTGRPSADAQIGHRSSIRWKNNEAIALLNDFDYLVQALFAEQSRTSLNTHNRVRAGQIESAEATKFERLSHIWHRLLPMRELKISGDDIEVSTPGSNVFYKASEMSDGERSVFYMIGQALFAESDSLLVIDEPELHVHRSIMSKLWDELEAARPDCGFVYITHDLEFAAHRVARKFVIQNYDPKSAWTLDAVPEQSEFPEEVATLILGSRRPILFVEGGDEGLDAAIFRCCFPEWTVVPRGSCENVVHAVVTMRGNSELTRIACAGVVDADGHNSDDVEHMRSLGVEVLPVSEMENLILLPPVSRAIAESESYAGEELESRLEGLKSAIFELVNTGDTVEAAVLRHCRRQIDRILKRIDLRNATSVEELQASYAEKAEAVRIGDIADARRKAINSAIAERDLPRLLAVLDHKGMFALAATHLKSSRLSHFEAWFFRVLRGDKHPQLAAAVRAALPVPQAR